MVDAAFNRTLEGLRVLEDTARMIFDDVEMTGRLKRLRHDTASLLINDSDLANRAILARAAGRDVLRKGETDSESRRDDLLSVVRSNARRAQEALRTLEECSKCLPALDSSRAKDCRFALYDIERDLVALLVRQDSLDRLRSGVYVGLNASGMTAGELTGAVEVIGPSGGSAVCLHDIRPAGRDMIDRSRAFAAACASAGIMALVSSRPDIARSAGADGVELGVEDASPDESRDILGPGALIGIALPVPDMGMNADYFIVTQPGTPGGIAATRSDLPPGKASPVIIADAVNDRMGVVPPEGADTVRIMFDPDDPGAVSRAFRALNGE